MIEEAFEDAKCVSLNLVLFIYLLISSTQVSLDGNGILY